VGGFREGNMHGQGTFTYLDGSRYTGGFKKGRRNGQGVYTATDGSRYSGTFKNDSFEGHDILFFHSPIAGDGPKNKVNY
jgi:hypothetical protein